MSTCRSTTVSVGIRKIFQRRSRHEKVLQDTFFHYSNAPCLYALIVILVCSHQVAALVIENGRIKRYTDRLRQNRFTYFRFESLSVIVALKAMAFYTVPEYF